MNVIKPITNFASRFRLGTIALVTLAATVAQPTATFAQTAATRPDVAPTKATAPASPIPAPAGSDPVTVAIAPDAPMPELVPGLQPPHTFDVAAAQFDQGRYKDAVAQLIALPKFSSYKETAYVPAALYRAVQIDRDYLHDDTAAMLQLTALKNTYSSAIYPGSATALAERTLLASQIDLANSKKPLSFDPTHLNVYPIISSAVKLTGSRTYSYWIALLMIAVLVRVVLTPLTIKQYKGMREMQRLQPLLKEIQAKYDKDPQVKGQKMMELYKEHNVSPMSGCLPMLLQLPVYYGMYQAIVEYQYHFLHGTFAWVNPSTADAVDKARVFGFPFTGVIGHNLSEQDMPLLVIYSLSMYITQRMMPATDPSQAEMQKTTALMMSVFFFFMFIQWHFPSAFVLYWLFSNILGTVTQLYFTRQGLRTPAGALPILPSDGDGKGGNGNGARPIKPTPSLPGGNGSKKPVGAKPVSASMGVIAPRTSSKKKRR